MAVSEERRVALNVERLQLVDDSIRDKVESCLRTLEHYGHRPVIAREVWRDPEKQLDLYRRGRSKVRWGFHCATTPGGNPASLAADIVGVHRGWNVGEDFWLCLCYAADSQGLGWGGYFGMPRGAPRERLSRIAREVTRGARTLASVGKIYRGWDPAHVETARVSITEAKAGKR